MLFFDNNLSLIYHPPKITVCSKDAPKELKIAPSDIVKLKWITAQPQTKYLSAILYFHAHKRGRQSAQSALHHL